MEVSAFEEALRPTRTAGRRNFEALRGRTVRAQTILPPQFSTFLSRNGLNGPQ